MTRRTPRELYARAKSEDDFTKAQSETMAEEELRLNIRSAMLQLGWKHAHTYDSRRSDPGLFDIIGARMPRFIVVECKRQNGVLTPEQHAWALETIPNPGVEVYVLRPVDWLDGTVLAILMAREPPMDIIGRVLRRERLA